MKLSLVFASLVVLSAGSILKSGKQHYKSYGFAYLVPAINPPEQTRQTVNVKQEPVEPSDEEKQRVVLALLTNAFHETEANLEKTEREHFPFRHGNAFHNHEGVLRFLRDFNKNGFLPRDEVFSPSNQEHLNQAAQLFNFLYCARDWDTFHQAALWARRNFNQQQFTFAFLAAVLNLPTTSGVTLPALYEIFPHAFVPATALHKIYNAKFEGRTKVTVSANYTNQNRNNNAYNRFDSDDNPYDHDNQNTNSNRNPHNPGSVFANNDGSPFSTAGTPENPENRISYFTEDIGVNAMLAGMHAQIPSFFGRNYDMNYWISNRNNYDNVEGNSKNFHYKYDNKADVDAGNEFYFVQQQLYARYVLERISNQLPIPEPINFNGIIKPGYNPRLQHSNGDAVPARAPNAAFQQLASNDNNNLGNALQPNNDQAQNPSIYEQRLQQVADSAFVVNVDGSQTKLTVENGVAVLANLATAPGRSPNPGYYGNYFSTASNAIGYIADPSNQNSVAPGPVSNFATAARDPAYYKLLAKFLQIFNNYLNNQVPYSPEQLSFAGVKIQSFNISRLITYFEDYTVDVNNAVYEDFPNSDSKKKSGKVAANYQVVFQRLTCNRFNYRLEVDSTRDVEAEVRIFIGPKFNSNGQLFTLPQAGQYFVQLDRFNYQLRSGKNVIERNSQQSVNFSPDFPGFSDLWKQVRMAEQGQRFSNSFKETNRRWRLPQRMQLPKGTADGQEFVMYAIINKNESNKKNDAAHKNELKTTIEDLYPYVDAPYFMTADSNIDASNEETILINRGENMRIRNLVEEEEGARMKVVHQPRSIAFPFDRPVQDVNFNSPNQIFETVKVFHKTFNGRKN
ncbi:hypothetical protein LSTR_LSTR008835 [Laodelphax striatellus]|uniref:Uncharacterized protein n=1 Tax=Laodelphax striatellus TaxID=195883 RepID=A0A482WS29_LAOST|nr:hypothetical protein LSTR_LSTR008835 [Laodelphax striatellus]